MNKISKKILAIVTMAAFVVTMMPFAAFAAEYGSTVAVVEDSQEVTMKTDGTADIDITVNLVAEDATAINAAGDSLYVWLEKDGTAYNSYATYSNGATKETTKQGTLNGTGVITVDTDVAQTKTATITVKNSGEYTVHAGYTSDTDAVNISDLKQLSAGSIKTATVEAAETVVEDITFSGTDVTGNELDYDATPNGINAKDVTLKVTGAYVDADDDAPAIDIADETVDITNPYSNLHVQQEGKDVEQVETKADGTAVISIVADYGINSGVYTLKFTAGDVTKELKVNIPDDEAVAQTIEAVDMENNIVASDKKGTLEDAVQFIVKDANGNEMDFDELSAADKANVKVTNYPEDFDPADYTINLAGADDNKIITLSTDKTLPVGEYTVRVAIEKGANADATFVVKKFDTKNIVEMKLVATNTDVEKSSEVAMGTDDPNDSKYVIKPVWVDANGVTKDATANVGIKAGTVASDSGVRYNADMKTLVIPVLDDSDTDKNNTALIGSVVTIQAVDPTNGFYISRDFTIVDPANTAGVSLAFDSDNGSVEKNNKVEVIVVDADGNKTEIADTSVVDAYVADQSNEDAYVQASVTEYKNGKATLTVYADQETTADIVVYLVSGTGSDAVVYGGTLNYTFGEADVNADTTVAMTIGSSDIIVNNDIVSGDAAPFVDSNWRTMVPVRALSEAFGGTAEWDGDARTVTVVNGDTTIVFDADSNKYTVNGEEKEMDTNLTIVDGRTYVPVRFVADELGYQITVLKDAQGLTAGVVFQK